MKLPKEALQLVQKIITKIDVKHSYCALCEMLDQLDANWKRSEIISVSVASEPCGSLQNCDEFVDQDACCGTTFYGVYYYAVENSNYFIAIEYEC